MKLADNWREVWKHLSAQIFVLIGVVATVDFSVLDGVVDQRAYMALAAIGVFAKYVNQNGSAGLLQAAITLAASLKQAKQGVSK